MREDVSSKMYLCFIFLDGIHGVFSRRRIQIGIIILFFFSRCNDLPPTIRFPDGQSEVLSERVSSKRVRDVEKVTPVTVNLKKEEEVVLKRPSSVLLRKTDERHLVEPISVDLLPQEYKSLLKLPVCKTAPKIVMLGEPLKRRVIRPQVSEKSISTLSYLNQDNGLAGNFVYTILRTRNGDLWVGTNKGLCKFDGDEWWIYNKEQGLSSNHVKVIKEGVNGDLLVGTLGGGLNIVSYGKGYIKQYTVENGLNNDDVLDLLESEQGEIIMGTSGGGINILNNAREEVRYLNVKEGLSNGIVMCLLSNNGELIAGTQEGGLNIIDFNRGLIKEVSSEHGLSSDIIMMVTKGRHEEILIATRDGGLSVLDRVRRKISIYRRVQGLTSDYIRCIHEDTNGNYLVGTQGGGFNIVNRKDSIIHVYSVMEGLSNDYVKSLCVISDEDLWIGTYGGGVNVLNYRGMDMSRMFFNKESASNIIIGIIERNINHYVVGVYGGGVSIVDTKRGIIDSYTKEQGISSNEVSAIGICKNSDVLVGTYGSGLNIVSSKAGRVKRMGVAQGLSSNDISATFESRSGKIVVGTFGGGINVVDMERKVIKKYNSANGLRDDVVLSLSEGLAGEFFIGTHSNGLVILNDRDGVMEHYEMEQGLCSNEVVSVFENNNTELFIGTDRGLNILDRKEGRIRTILLPGEYSNDPILSISKDSLGSIWLGTERIVCCLALVDKGYRIRTIYDKAKGLQSNINSMLRTKSGWIWIGSGSVLTTFKPQYMFDSIKPVVNIKAIAIMNRKVNWFNREMMFKSLRRSDTVWSPELDSFYVVNDLKTDTSTFPEAGIKYTGVSDDIYHLPEKLELPYDQNHVTFHFSTTSLYDATQEVYYRYIMEGLNKEWSPMVSKWEADYRNLPPGNYSFKVAACIMPGSWSKPHVFSFTVRKPWYQAWWMYVVYLSFFLCCILGYNFWRVRNLRALSKAIIQSQEEEKLRISRELHDDLGQELSFLKMSGDVKNTVAIDRVIKKLRALSYDLGAIRLTKSQFKENLEDLVISAEKSGMFFSHEIDDVVIDDVNVRINLYRIAQEAINNSIKHSKAKNARVVLYETEKTITLEVMDDGMGMKMGGEYKTMGMISMRERAKLIGAKLSIVSEGKGTKVILKMDKK
ncbi:MAG: two-component regulator propeller domain-containing protein [Sediminibacterium sp.]|nr:two-component regulator propeller domain-containing protein [Sediminibacterium sp.]